MLHGEVGDYRCGRWLLRGCDVSGWAVFVEVFAGILHVLGFL